MSKPYQHEIDKAIAELTGLRNRRIKALIEANRNPRCMSQDDFDAWVMGPKMNLFKRRAAEALWTLRSMRQIRAEQGRNYSHLVAVHMARVDNFLSQARTA